MLTMRSLLVLLMAFKFIKSEPKDSYLNAYKVTHKLNAHKRDTREDMDYPVYQHQNYPFESQPVHDYDSYNTLEEYKKKPDYEPAKYGPPETNNNQKQIYGASPVYGSPVPIYGPAVQTFPPLAQSHYHHYLNNNNAALSFLPPVAVPEAIPYAFFSLWDKIRQFKWDLFKIGKILLALVIFKKFISFSFILFLLFVIPKLKTHKKKKKMDCDNDDCNRKVFDHKRLNTITQYVLQSIEKFEDDFFANGTNKNS